MSEFESDIPVTEVPASPVESLSPVQGEMAIVEPEMEPVVELQSNQGSMPQMDLEWFSSQIFWLVVTFAFLYLLLSRSILPRIHNVLESRQNKITHDIDRAEQLRNEAEEARESYERALKESRAKAQSLIAESSSLMEKTSAARHAELDKKIEKQLADAEATIAASKADAMAKLSPVSTELTQHIVQKLTGQKLTDKEVSTVVESLIKEKSHA